MIARPKLPYTLFLPCHHQWHGGFQYCGMCSCRLTAAMAELRDLDTYQHATSDLQEYQVDL